MMTSICQTDSCQANVWSIQQCGSSALLQCFLLFSFGSSGYQLGCTIAVVSVQRPVEPVKNALQNIANEGTPRIVIIPRVLFKIGPFLNPYKATSVLCSNLSLSLCHPWFCLSCPPWRGCSWWAPRTPPRAAPGSTRRPESPPETRRARGKCPEVNGIIS